MKSMERTISETIEVVVSKIARVRKGDRVLMVVDESTEFLVGELESNLIRNEKRILRLSAGGSVPKNALSAGDVIFVFTKDNICFSKDVSMAVYYGKRVICCASCTRSKLIKSIPEDLEKYNDLTIKLASSLKKDSYFEVTSWDSHRITGKIDKFPPRYIGFLMGSQSSLSILPGGIIGVPVIPGTVNGEISINGFIQESGRVNKPVLLKIEEGNSKVLNPSDAPKSFLESVSSSWFRPCELGTGANPNSETSKDIHESESELGIIDFGFGENKHIGGSIAGKSHFDVTTKKGTLRIDGRLIIDGGKIRI